jgi:putative transposase
VKRRNTLPDYRRLYIPGGTYFFTVTLFNRASDLLVREIGTLRRSWRDIVRRHPFETPAAVILPDHIHFLMALPEGDSDYSTRIRLIKSGFTKRLPESLKGHGRKGERKIWQQRFWEHAIRDEKDFEAHVNYIHHNPVKHGYVEDSDDWPHSTWHRFKREWYQTRNPG